MYSITEQMQIWLEARGYRTGTRPPYDGPDAPSEFLTIERTGGEVSDMVDHPAFVIQAWAPTEARAEEILLNIREALLTEARPVGVHHIAINSGPYPFFDEETRCPRYQLVLDITSQLTT